MSELAAKKEDLGPLNKEAVITANALKERFLEENMPLEQRRIVESFVIQILAKPELAKYGSAALAAVLHRALEEEIYLDGYSYILVPRGKGRIDLHENLPATIEKIKDNFKIIIRTPFLISIEYEKELIESGKPFPLLQTDIPVKYLVNSMLDLASVVIVATDLDHNVVDTCVYSRDVLLDGVGKRISGNTLVGSTNTWNLGNHGLEMLKKTALRKFVKYKSYGAVNDFLIKN